MPAFAGVESAPVRNRLVTMLALGLACPVAAAAVTCEQYGAIAQQTVRLRDQGTSLKRLLADVDRGEMKEKLTPHERAVVRNVVRHSFEGTLAPAEVVEACREGGAVVPQR